MGNSQCWRPPRGSLAVDWGEFRSSLPQLGESPRFELADLEWGNLRQRWVLAGWVAAGRLDPRSELVEIAWEF